MKPARRLLVVSQLDFGEVLLGPAARQFEQQMRLIQTAENDDKSAAQLLSLNG